MKMSDTIAELAAALSIAQGQIDDAAKTVRNDFYKSKYADLASVRAAIRQPFADNGLSVVQFPRTVTGGVEVETMLLHTSGEFMAETLFMPSCPLPTWQRMMMMAMPPRLPSLLRNQIPRQ